MNRATDNVPRYGGLPAIAWLLLLALVVIGAGLGLRDPWPADEPRFALIARDMVESGRWLFPEIAGVLYPDKPPLYFWIMAACYALTGSLRVAFLLPSLIAALGTLYLVHDLARRLWDERTGLYAAAILLVTLQFTLQAKTAQIDAVLAFWTTLGSYGILRHLLCGPAWGWYAIGFAAAGAGVITKGVGFLPLLLFIPYAYARARDWNHLPRLTGGWRWLAGPLAMLAVIAAWLVPMLIVAATNTDAAYAAYRDEILFRQTATRYADAWHHLKPFWYYLVEVIPLFWLPAIVALPWLVPAWRRAFAERDARVMLLLAWIALVVLFFSASPGKRGVYLLPAVPAFALSVAPYAHALLARRGVQRAGLVVLALITAVWSLALLYFLAIAPEKGAELVARHDVAPWTLFAALAAAGALWLVLRPRRGMHALAGYFLSLWMIYGLLGYPLINPARSPAGMMASVARTIGPDAELALADWKEQLVLHADRPVVHFGFRRRDPHEETRDALHWLLQGGNRHVLLPESALVDCLDPARLKVVDFVHRSRWLLADANAIRPDCRARLAARVPDARPVVTTATTS